MSQIIIINPNSNVAVTEAIDRRLDVIRQGGGPELVCLTLQEGPWAIETMEHCRQVVAPLCKLASQAHSADAFVIGCFSDPGLPELRALTRKPVFGFCEAGVASAMALGGRYGILTNLQDDIADERAYLEANQLDARLAAIEAVGVPVSQLATNPNTLQRMIEATGRLERQGAGTVVLGCAGFSAFASQLQQATDVAIVDPPISAAAMAVAAVVSRSRSGSSSGK